jgi:hypothetical protein
MSYRINSLLKVAAVFIGLAIAYCFNSRELGYWGWQVPVCLSVLLILILIRLFYRKGQKRD